MIFDFSFSVRRSFTSMIMFNGSYFKIESDLTQTIEDDHQMASSLQKRAIH